MVERVACGIFSAAGVIYSAFILFKSTGICTLA